jgi:aspartyl-tRNA(Asn)/glutamyl-tRNA(Gln) amidotransferase subunit C
MEVNKELILKLEKLSRLELSESERVKIQKDLGNMLNMVEKLNELDTTGVEPLIYISDEENVLREDVIKNQVSRENALKNAPNHNGEFFQVPKMIKK